MNRFLPEDIEEDQKRGEAFLTNAMIRLLHGFDAHSEVANLALPFQLTEMLEHLAALQHLERHAVQLRQIERLHAQPEERCLRVPADARTGEVLRPARRREPSQL